ncbi:hypothetical protein ABW19_dt0206690 [Dactylella cylindrospora]|nr:hypothetical protein ABW19_dt0206690 [Dactylella cylindrospora]
MATIANQENIPPNLNYLYKPPNLRLRSISPILPVLSYSPSSTPPGSAVATPICSPETLVHLGPPKGLDSGVTTCGTRMSNEIQLKTGIEFPKNILPDQAQILEELLKQAYEAKAQMQMEIEDMPLQTSTPEPLSKFSAEQAGWKNSTVKGTGPNTAKRVYEQEEIRQVNGPLKSNELFYDKKVRLFRNFGNEEEIPLLELAPAAEEEAGKEAKDARDPLLSQGQESPPKMDIDSSGDVEMPDYTSMDNAMIENTCGTNPPNVTKDSIMLPQKVLPPFTPTSGLRAARCPATSYGGKKVAFARWKIHEDRHPKTEPRRPVKGISETPKVNRTPATSGLFAAGKNTGDTTRTHRTYTWYDSTSLSPLESSGELAEIAAKAGKKNIVKSVGRPTKVAEKILPSSSDEEVEEVSETDDDNEMLESKSENDSQESEESEEEDSEEEGSDYEDDGGTPSKKTWSGKGSGGKLGAVNEETEDSESSKEEDSSEIEDEERNDKDSVNTENSVTPSKSEIEITSKMSYSGESESIISTSKEESVLEKSPTPKKAGKKKKKPNKDDAAFKLDGEESEVEEEFEESKPKHGKKKLAVDELKDNIGEPEVGEEDIGESSDAAAEGQEVSSTGSGEHDQGESGSSEMDEEDEEEEGGEGEEVSGNSGSGSSSGSGSGSSEGGSDEGDSERDSEEEASDSEGDEKSEAPENEDEDEDAEEEESPGMRNEATSKSLPSSNLQKSATEISRLSLARRIAHKNSNKTPSSDRKAPPPTRTPKSNHSEGRHMMKERSLQSRRTMMRAQTEEAFRLQEEFVKKGNVVREAPFTKLLPSSINWFGAKKNVPLPPPIIPAKPSTKANPGPVAASKRPTKGNPPSEGPSSTPNISRKDRTNTQTSKISGKSSSQPSQVADGGKVYELTGEELEEMAAELDDALDQLDDSKLETDMLKGRLAKQTERLNEALLKLGAKKSLSYDCFSFMYDFRPKEGFNDFTGKYRIDPAPLKKLEFEEPGDHNLAQKLAKNPFHHKDMSQRRKIINDLTFPSNVMLAEFGTDYFFKCCNCRSVSEVRFLFFQDELIWSTCICFTCFDHFCCADCTRYTAPTDKERMPKNGEMIDSFDASKGNYESWMYMKGIWNDFLRQKDRKENHEARKAGAEVAQAGLDVRMQQLDEMDEEFDAEYEEAAGKAAKMGLRSARGGGNQKGKRKRVEVEQQFGDVEEPAKSKRRMILEKRQELEHMRWEESRLPLREYHDD